MADWIQWKDIGRTLAGLAPTIAATLVSVLPGGGLASPLVALAVSELEKALGIGFGDGKSSPEDVSNALGMASPEMLLKLKEADQRFQLALKQADIDLEKVFAEDRASARHREAEVKDSTPRVLAYIVLSTFCAVVGAILGCSIANILHLDATSSALVGAVIGYLSSKADIIVAYYFGSSSGSKQKTDALAEIASKGASK